MKYLNLFESFDIGFEELPGNFLVRGVKRMPKEYIDDPSQRKISLADNEGNIPALHFFNRFENFDLPNPRKSVHFIFSDDFERSSRVLTRFGKLYKVTPEKDCLIGYFNGNFLNKRFYVDFVGSTFHDLVEGERRKQNSHVGENSIEVMDSYLREMLDKGFLGTITYDEMKELIMRPTNQNITKFFNSENKMIQLWTSSPCKLKLIE
jgi:hypothetical protein